MFVVLRVDLFHATDSPLETIITPKQVLRSEELAQREVARLNATHSDGQIRYWYAHSRLFPPGRSASSVEEPA